MASVAEGSRSGPAVGTRRASSWPATRWNGSATWMRRAASCRNVSRHGPDRSRWPSRCRRATPGPVRRATRMPGGGSSGDHVEEVARRASTIEVDQAWVRQRPSRANRVVETEARRPGRSGRSSTGASPCVTVSLMVYPSQTGDRRPRSLTSRPRRADLIRSPTGPPGRSSPTPAAMWARTGERPHLAALGRAQPPPACHTSRAGRPNAARSTNSTRRQVLHPHAPPQPGHGRPGACGSDVDPHRSPGWSFIERSRRRDRRGSSPVDARKVNFHRGPQLCWRAENRRNRPGPLYRARISPAVSPLQIRRAALV